MTLASLVLGEKAWLLPIGIIAAVAVVLVIYSYKRTKAGIGLAGLVKVIGLLLLLGCLLEPLWSLSLIHI